MKNKTLNNIFFLMLILMMAFITSLSLNSNPFSDFLPGHDSSMFIYFGQAMNNGKIVYTEIFDHKGPMIFLINYLGIILSTKNIQGIYFLELISLYIYFVFTFKTIKLWIKPHLSYISLIPQALILVNLLEGGNLTEEYALPFIGISLYIIAKYYRNNTLISFFEVFFLGVAGAVVFSLRANMIVFWLVFCILVFLEKIIKKEYQQLIKFVLLFILGLLTVFVPIGLYLWVNNAFEAAIFQSITFNIMYLDASADKNEAIRVLYNILSNNYIIALFALFLVYVILIWTKKSKIEKIFYVGIILFFIGSFLTSVMSGRTYKHYLMAMLPTMTIPIALLLDKIFHKNKLLTEIIVSLIFISLIYYPQIYSVYEMMYIKNVASIEDSIELDKKQQRVIDNLESKEYLHDIASIIQRNSNPDDEIYVHNVDGNIYLLSDRLSSIKYFNLPAVNINKNEMIGKDFLQEIYKSETELVILTTNYYKQDKDGTNKEFIDYVIDNYELIYNDDEFHIFKLK